MSILSRLFRRSLLVACAAALSACSSDESDVAPCPPARVLGDASELTRFAGGSGRDPVDIAFEASFRRVAGECGYREGGGDIDVELTVVLDIARGPALGAEAAAFSYFVAVSERAQDANGEPAILARRSFAVEVPFAEGRKGLRYTDTLEVTIPRAKGRPVSDYAMYLGFELTDEELRYNRRGR